MTPTNKTKKPRPEEPDEPLVKPGQANWVLDARRNAEETKVFDDALEVLEQRSKEIAAHIKTGIVCDDAHDKQHSIYRCSELLADMQRVCAGFVTDLVEDAQ